MRLIAFALYLLAATSFAQVPINPVARPNIVFIMADDLGWGDLGAYGRRLIHTPTLDELATEGTLFTNYSAAACVCSPARAAIVSGRFPAEVGVHNAITGNPSKNAGRGQVDFLPPSPDLLPRRLQTLGYTTGHFGKWHLGTIGDIPLSEYGFDVHRSTLSGSPNPKYTTNDAWWWSSSDWIVDDAIDFIQTAQDPFYIHLWLSTPHSPLDPTPAQAAEYTANVTAEEPVNGWTSGRHAYFAAITAMDGAIARLLDEIDALGLTDDTIVVFTSDNGPESMYERTADHAAEGHSGPFRGRKGSIYEGGHRAPLIVRWPGVVPADTVSDAQLAAVDWLPTFVGLSGGLAASSGENVLRALRGDPWTRTTPVMLEWRFGPRIPDQHRIDASPGGGIVLGDWAFLRNRDGSRRELYNLASDIMQVDNVLTENPTIAADLEAQLLAWQATLGPCVGCENEGDNIYRKWPQ